ncbi:MAG: antitoxin [Thermoanaerobaculia bacterium]
MSKRLQVLLQEPELREIQKVAREHRMTVAEWVRQALRQARRNEPSGTPSRKLEAVRKAVRCNFPSGEIEDMLADIERGYAGGPPR